MGLPDLAGVDTSPESVKWLSARGIEAHLLVRDAGVMPALSFRPRVVLLLDVIEHFEPASLQATVRAILDALRPDLEGVVVKVPLSDGLLFRAARWLATVRSTLIEQMFLVDTSAPHTNYFSARSLRSFMDAVGLVPLRILRDPEFEADTLASRAQIGGPRAARRLADLGGRAALAAVRALRLEDSVIVFARPDGR